MSGTVRRVRIRAAIAQRRAVRAKISTTVAPETLEFLDRKVRSGEVANLAMALDTAIAKVRQIENRQGLAKATAAYFAELDQKTMTAENNLAKSIASASLGVDHDKEL